MFKELYKNKKNKSKLKIFLSGIACGIIGLIITLFVIFIFQEWYNEKLWGEAIYAQEIEEEEEQDWESNIDSPDNAVEITNAPTFGLVEGEYGTVLYIDNVENGTERKVAYNGHEITHLQFSPSNKKIGFYYESGNYESAGRDTALVIMNVENKSVKQVYEGSYKTSNWEWLNDKEVVVYYGCGAECVVAYVIDVEIDREKKTLQYGVGYEWSPSKELVLTYNYSGRYGVTIGDKKGGAVFSIKRERPYEYSSLVDKTKAAWSPDSSKMAVIIKKENQEALELLIFDVEEDFKQIFQFDIDFFGDMELVWGDNNKMLTLNNRDFFIIP